FVLWGSVSRAHLLPSVSSGGAKAGDDFPFALLEGGNPSTPRDARHEGGAEHALQPVPEADLYGTPCVNIYQKIAYRRVVLSTYPTSFAILQRAGQKLLMQQLVIQSFIILTLPLNVWRSARPYEHRNPP